MQVEKDLLLPILSEQSNLMDNSLLGNVCGRTSCVWGWVWVGVGGCGKTSCVGVWVYVYVSVCVHVVYAYVLVYGSVCLHECVAG